MLSLAVACLRNTASMLLWLCRRNRFHDACPGTQRSADLRDWCTAVVGCWPDSFIRGCAGF